MTTIYKQPRNPKWEFTVPESQKESDKDFRNGIKGPFFPFPLKQGVKFKLGPFETFLHPDWSENNTKLPCFTHEDHPDRTFVVTRGQMNLWSMPASFGFEIAERTDLCKPKRKTLRETLTLCEYSAIRAINNPTHTFKASATNLKFFHYQNVIFSGRYYDKEIHDIYLQFDGVAETARKLWVKQLKLLKQKKLEEEAEAVGMTLKEFMESGLDKPALKMSIERTQWVIDNTAKISEFKNELDDLLAKMMSGQPYKGTQINSVRSKMDRVSRILWNARGLGKVR